MKLLLVEDQAELAKNIQEYFQKEGDICELALSIFEAENKVAGFEYDVLLLDLMLPDGDGISFLEQVKKSRPDMGVVIVSAKDSLDDKLKGLDIGADDYLPKPFHLAELNARAKAVYRRRQQEGNNEISFEEIRLDMSAKEANIDGHVLNLTNKEFELLHYFIVNKNRLVTKQAIAEHLWGDYMDSADSFDFVYQHIKNLRKRIEEAGGQDYVRTVYGAGYKFKKE